MSMEKLPVKMWHPDDNLSLLVWTIAVECAEKGFGWANESIVLREVGDRIPAELLTPVLEQYILRCWHDLFMRGRLCWGHNNLRNHCAPYFLGREAPRDAVS